MQYITVTIPECNINLVRIAIKEDKMQCAIITTTGSESKMSKGYCGYAHLIGTDDSQLLYSYYSRNLNLESSKSQQIIEDGEICIIRSSLVEPKIHKKIKHLPSGKKENVTKRVRQEIPIYSLLKAGKIKIQNSSGTWETDEEGNDIVAINLSWKVFEEYQDKGTIPEHLTWII